MKKLYLFLSLIAAICASNSYSQCVEAELTYFGPPCPIGQVLLGASANVNCPGATSITFYSYIDGVQQNYTSTNLQTIWTIALNLSSNLYPQDNSDVVIVEVYDTNGALLGSDDIQIVDIWDQINPNGICSVSFTQSCDYQCNMVTMCGANPPVMFVWGDGLSNWSSQNAAYHCYGVPGMYQVTSVDENGCQGAVTIGVEFTEPQGPSTCDVAEELIPGEVLHDSLCNLVTGMNDCYGYADNTEGWYHINSQNYSHVGFGIVPGYDAWAFAIYEMQVAGDCSSLQQIYCSGQPGYGSQCLDIADYVTIQPFTEYYFQYIAPSLFQTIEIVAMVSNDVISSLCGCIDPNGCNYNPDALLGAYWECTTPGCSDQAACNFQYWAGCDDGSCIYGDNMNAQLYYDTNGDGVMQSNLSSEPPLGNVGYITIEETGTIAFADNDGHIEIPELPAGDYHITYTDMNGLWELSPGSDGITSLPTCDGFSIGLVPTSSEALYDVYPIVWGGIACQNGFSPGIMIHNSGSVPLNGIVTISYDENGPMAPSYSTWGAPYDSDINGLLTWNIVNQAPGTTILYNSHFQGPGASYVGQSFDFAVSLTLVDGNDAAIYDHTWEISPVVSCSYDPNDKSATPIGYAEPHYILADNEIEYTIRFQNTGNAAAERVMIEDQLDTDELDIHTFHPVGSSHSFNTIMSPDGNVQFVFDNINLPDSSSDEEGSHGFVVYRIASRSNLQGGEEIHNTASIYFDDNPAIVTNTTTHTIYNCEWLNLSPQDENICAGEFVTDDFSQLYVETYAWTLDGEVLPDNTPMLSVDLSSPGEHEIGLTRSNPLCTVSAIIPVTVLSNPEITISFDINTGMISGPVGYTYAWYIDGQFISQVMDNSINPWLYVPDAQEAYAEITDTNGCMGTTNTVFYSGVNERSNSAIKVYPNPMSTSTTLSLPGGKWNIELYNSTGQLQRTWQNISSSLRVENDGMPGGAYYMNLVNEQGEKRNVVLVVE